MPKIEFDPGVITSVREQKGLSYQQFGKYINAAKESVQSWEENITTPSAKHITNMCNEFGIVPKAFWKPVSMSR